MNNVPAFFQLHKKPIIGVLCLLAIVIPLVIFFANNVIGFVTINGAPSSAKISLNVTRNGETETISGTGIAIIPRDSEILQVTAGDTMATSSSLSLPWYGFVSKTLDLKPSKDAEKVAFASPAGLCAAYNSNSDKLLGLDCGTTQALYEYQTPSDGIWGDRPIKDLSYIDNQLLPPYMNGVIGISETSATIGSDSHDTPIAIKATSPQNTRSFEAPDGINGENLTGLTIYTDISSTSNDRFVIVDRFGVVQLAKPGANGNNDVSYKTSAAPDTYNHRYNTTACSLSGERLLCYRGRTKDAIPEGTTALTQAKIEEYSFDDGLVSSKTIESSAHTESLYVTDDMIYGIADKALYTLVPKGDSYISTQIVKNVTGVASDNKTLYYTKDKKAYTYNPTTDSSHLLFTSPNITVIGFYPVDEKVFLFGTAKHGDGAIYAYRLTGDSNGSKRALDVLPLAYEEIDGLLANDLVADKVFLQPASDSAASDQDIKNNFINTVSSHGIELQPNNVQIRR